MNMAAGAPRRHIARLADRMQRLLEPAPGVQDEMERNRASNLALLTLTGSLIQGGLVVVLLLAGQGTHDVTTLIVFSGLATLGAYGLSRTRFYRVGLLLVIATLLGMAYGWALHEPADTVRLQLMALPVIATGYMLPLRVAVPLSAVAVAVLTFLLTLLAPEYASTRVLNLVFVAGVGAISYIGALSQRRLEKHLLRHSLQLILSERKLRGVIEHSLDGVLLVDENGIVIEWNAGCERITGMSHDEAVGLPIWEVTARLQDARGDGTWPDRNKVFTRLMEMLQTGTGRWHSRLLENTIRTRDGEERRIQSRLFPIPVSGRFMVGGLVRDITEQVQAQTEVAQTAALLRATLDSTAEAILVVGQDRRIVTYNRQYLELWNLPADTAPLLDWPEQFERMASQVLDRERFGARAAELLSDLDSESAELIALQDGRTLERHATPYRVNGQSVGRVYTYMDVTQRQQAEDALRQSENRFAIAFQTSPDAITISRLSDSRYLAVNEGFTSLTGYAAAEVVGKTVADLNLWVYPDERDTLLNTLRAHGEMRDLEAVFQVKNGERRTGLISARLLELDGELCVLSIARDITERKQLEAQRLELAVERERVTMLQQFISDASHDLMTPITVLSTSVYLLNRYATDDRQREHIAKLKTQVDRLGKMIQDMLTMSRLDKPVEEEFEFRRSDLSVLMGRVISDHRGLAESKGQRLVYVAESLVPPLNIDADKLEQAAANLIENAIKYTQPGGLISVVIGVRDNRAFVRVRDTGPGIDPRDEPHIFKRFYRGKVHRPSEGGTGLGLSIVHKIVAAHGGEIEVDSTLEKGTTFIVWLPLS